MHVLVTGAGVAGLGTALAFSRRGHRVTLVERDATPLPADPHAAFEWDRRGAPQVRHSHAFLARLRNLLRDQHPDVLAALLEAGATELRFGDRPPPTMVDFEPEPGDEDLVALACRRTTFEWVLRRAVLDSGAVSLLDGVSVEGLHADGKGAAPTVRGVWGRRGGDPLSLEADLVVVAGGRRSDLPGWVGAAGGGKVFEEEDETDIVYYSRFFRIRDGVEAPPTEGPIGGDLGYLKYAVFQGDNGTYSVTLAPYAWDDELRSALRVPTVFDAAAAELTVTAPWVDPAVAEPITGVHVMARLVNRLRSLVVDERPVALGVHGVGDALVCTNPLYGRGCALGMVHAHLLADAVAEHGTDHDAVALAFHHATERELVPWYTSAVQQDSQNREAARAGGGEPGFLQTVLREGLFPATRTDPVVFRAFVRTFNLLDPPDAMLRNEDVVGRIMQAMQNPDKPEPPVLGPELREDLLAAITAAGPTGSDG